MRRIVRLGVLLGWAALLGWPAGSGAQEPAAETRVEELLAQLTVTVAPDDATIGDRLVATLTLTLLQPIDGVPRFPVWEEHWGDAEILDVSQPEALGDGVWRQRLTVAVFQTGLATLPKPAVRLPGPNGPVTVLADRPTVVDVRSVLPEGEEEPAPLPPEPPRRLAVGERFWWTAVVLGLACAVLGLLAFRAAARVARTLATLRLTPLEALERALGKLRRESDGERIVAGVSLELRRYLGRTLGFPAAEGTTTEIQRELRRRDVPRELLRPSLDLLREADRVKFARAPIDAAQASSQLDAAERIAAGVEEWLRPAAEDDEDSEAAA